MEDKRYKKRLAELKKIYKELPTDKLTLLSSTIETVAFMDIQMQDLQEIIAGGDASTPDKQLYTSIAKTRDSLVKKLLSELPAPKEDADDFDNF